MTGESEFLERGDIRRSATTARPDTVWDLTVLVVVVGIVLAAFALDVVSTDRVALRGLPEHPLPHLCPSRAWFGIACPACGLTRSVIYMAQGRWQESLAAHRLGWLVAAVLLAQIPWRAWRISRPDRAATTWRFSEVWLWGGLLAVLIVNRLAQLVEVH